MVCFAPRIFPMLYRSMAAFLCRPLVGEHSIMPRRARVWGLTSEMAATLGSA